MNREGKPIPGPWVFHLREELDGLYVGPYDLSMSLGLASLADFDDPALLRAAARDAIGLT